MRPRRSPLSTCGLALAALTVAACSRTPRVLSIAVETLERSAGDCAVDPRCARFTAEYPRVRTTRPVELRPKLNGIVREMLLASQVGDGASTTLESLADGFVATWRESSEAFPEPTATLRWTVDKRMRVLLEQPGLWSVELVDESYTGGAHGMESTRLATVDLAQARRLRIDDVLVPGGRERLLVPAERAFRAARGVPPETPLTQAGFQFPGGAFALTENFAIAAEGLRFHFDAYEIAAYAAGPSDFTVAWIDLDELVRPEWRPR